PRRDSPDRQRQRCPTVPGSAQTSRLAGQGSPPSHASGNSRRCGRAVAGGGRRLVGYVASAAPPVFPGHLSVRFQRILPGASMSRYVVGIDLGTTNSALAYADTRAASPEAPAPIQSLAI